MSGRNVGPAVISREDIHDMRRCNESTGETSEKERIVRREGSFPSAVLSSRSVQVISLSLH